MRRLYSLQGQGVVVLAGLAVPDEVAALLAESQQVLGLSSADGSVIPSGEKREGQNPRPGPHSRHPEFCFSPRRLGPLRRQLSRPGPPCYKAGAFVHSCPAIHRHLPSARCLPDPGEDREQTHSHLPREADILVQVLRRRQSRAVRSGALGGDGCCRQWPRKPSGESDISAWA